MSELNGLKHSLVSAHLLQDASLPQCFLFAWQNVPSFPQFPFIGEWGRGKLLSKLPWFICLLSMHLLGEVKTFQRGDLGRHGMFFKIIPKFSYKRHKNQRHFTGCWKRYGTKSRKAKAQSILPCNAAWPFKSRLEDFKVNNWFDCLSNSSEHVWIKDGRKMKEMFQNFL